MKNIISVLIVLIFAFQALNAGDVNKDVLKKVKGKKVLIYTKNGEGYVHENIANSVKALKEICAGYDIIADVTDDPTAFSEGKLNIQRLKDLKSAILRK